jgi:hypothetical protein
MEKFLADYERGLREQRYITGELPSLPFDSGSFGLAVCSHLLFLYSDLLSEDFHIRSVLELCRVAGEVRLFAASCPRTWQRCVPLLIPKD